MLLDFHRMQSYADTEELGEAERAAAAVRQSINRQNISNGSKAY